MSDNYEVQVGGFPVIWGFSSNKSNLPFRRIQYRQKVDSYARGGGVTAFLLVVAVFMMRGFYLLGYGNAAHDILMGKDVVSRFIRRPLWKVWIGWPLVLTLLLTSCATPPPEPPPSDSAIERELRAVEYIREQRREGRTSIRFPLEP